MLVFRAMKGGRRPRVGGMEFSGMAASTATHRLQRLPHVRRDVGPAVPRRDRSGRADLAGVVLAQREYAVANPRAFRRRPLDLDQYLDAPIVVDPFRAGLHDRGRRSLRRAGHVARTGPRPAAPSGRRRAGGYRAGPRPGLDIGDHLPGATTPATTPHGWLRTSTRRPGSAGDVQFAEIYDCFTSTVLIGLEGLGLCERGGSGAFVRSGDTRLGGRCRPTPTAGCSRRATCTA